MSTNIYFYPNKCSMFMYLPARNVLSAIFTEYMAHLNVVFWGEYFMLMADI